MPFIVRWPGHVPANRIDDQSVVSGVDLLPTLSKWANQAVPENHALDGEDISDILLGKTRPRTRPLMWEGRMPVIGPVINQNPTLAIRDKEWKLLMNPDRSRIELYHITKDPTEVNNLALQHPDIVKRLSEQLLTWKKSVPGSVRDGAGMMQYNWPGKETK